MNRLTRRQFIKAAGISAAVVAAAPALLRGAAAPKAAGKPNILVIMSDEHNAAVMGCAGNKIVQTPNLDSLAARGVVFDACYTNSPLCVPSRLSFTAGKYASRVSAWNNDCWLPSDETPSIARIMNDAGYFSGLCGKMHYDATRRYGFTDVGGNMNKDPKTGRGGRRDPDDLADRPGLSGRFDQFHPAETGGVMPHDLAVTRGAVEFLRSWKPADKPFFLIAGYLAPHFPLIVPQKYWDAYKDKVPMPVIPPGYLESLPRNYKHLRVGFHVEHVPAEIVKKGRELYYGLTQWLDERIGQVLTALAESPAGADTVVIYTSDHGENMGQHGLWWKNCVYDTAARVPLIVSSPSRFAGAQRRAGACSLVDVVKTIAELGGAKAPADWNGDSMAGWLEDAGAKWKDQAVSEYYAHNIASGYAMIRQGKYKYVYHTPADDKHPAERELYDLSADPGELGNLAARPDQAERVNAMHAALVAEIGEDPDKTELRCRAEYAKGYGRGMAGGKQKKKAAAETRRTEG